MENQLEKLLANYNESGREHFKQTCMSLVKKRGTNAIITVFSICTGKYFPKSKYRYQGNIPDADGKNSYHSIYWLAVLKTFHRETKLFEFSRDTNREELKINKKVTLYQLRCNDFFVCYGFRFFLDKQSYYFSWQRAMPENARASTSVSKPSRSFLTMAAWK